MKRTNIKILFIAVVITAGLVFTSCENKISKPQINSLELGADNSKIGVIGSDLHIEAEVAAEAKIDDITIEIHTEDEKGWVYDSTFTEFYDKKNTTFHKHIEIPVEADTGRYHFHFTVTDQDGYQTTVEEELSIQFPSDGVAPVITITGTPVKGQSFNKGVTISISGFVSDDIALGGIYIGLVREGQNLSDEEVNAVNTITILHYHDFNDPTRYEFSAGITVGAAQDNNIAPKDITGDIAWQSSNYYILVKCKDAFGGNWTYSNHFPILINY